MRFTDLLRTTVYLSAGAATTLAAVTALAATRTDEENVLIVTAAWWGVAALIGVFVGRRAAVAPASGALLAEAKAATIMLEQRNGAVAPTRLWPLVVCTSMAGGPGFIAPQ